MRISEVEKLVGISKKNIRFYEEEGLLTPSREVGNGYRTYSDADVEILRRIRLLRRLAVPIEEIRKLGRGELSLRDCMERHAIYLNGQQRNLEHMKTVCAGLAAEGATLASIDVEACEERMRVLEEGGIRFMRTADMGTARKLRRRAAILAASVVFLFLAAMAALFVWAAQEDPIPLPVLLLLVGFFTAVMAGVLLALRERLREIEKGEEDEAFKY